MAKNTRARVYDSVAELIQQRGSNRVNAITLGYAHPSDRGGADWYWDDECLLPDDGVFIRQVPGVLQGRWRMILRTNTLNAAWFGCQPTWDWNLRPNPETFDNLPLATQAGEYMRRNPMFRVLYFPAAPDYGAGYYFSDSLDVRTSITIRGEEESGLSMFGTTFIYQNTSMVRFLAERSYYYTAKQYVPAGQQPPEIGDNQYWGQQPLDFYPHYAEAEYPNWDATVTYSAGQQVMRSFDGAREASMRKLRLYNIPESLYQSDNDKHGLYANCRLNLDGVYVLNAWGDGIHIHGNVMDRPGGSNANIGSIIRSGARFCAGDGININGGDANAWDITLCDFTSNKYWGMNDGALLSTKWNSCHTNNNSIYKGSTARVVTGSYVFRTIEGKRHYFGANLSSVGVLPVPRISSPVWYYMGDDLDLNEQGGIFTEWQPDVAYERLAFWQTRADNINQRPVVAGYNPDTDFYWTLAATGIDGNLFAGNVYVQWQPDKKFRGGGAFTASSAVGASQFNCCYSEMNQGHSVLRGRSKAEDGEMGTPVVVGSCVMHGGSGLTVPNGGVSAVAFGSMDDAWTMQFNNYGRVLTRTTRTKDFTVPDFQINRLKGGTAATFYVNPDTREIRLLGRIQVSDQDGSNKEYLDDHINRLIDLKLQALAAAAETKLLP